MNIHKQLAQDYSELARQEACIYIAYKTWPRQVFAVKSRRKINRLATKAKLRVIDYAEQVEHHLEDVYLQEIRTRDPFYAKG